VSNEFSFYFQTGWDFVTLPTIIFYDWKRGRSKHWNNTPFDLASLGYGEVKIKEVTKANPQRIL
jgi:hypothetical protein